VEKFVVGIRFWEGRQENVETAIGKLRKTIEDMRSVGAEKIFVAVNTSEDLSDAPQWNWPEYAEVFGVEPWGFFVQPLNAILIKARTELAQGYGVLFASTGTSVSKEGIEILLMNMDSNTIVVGATLEGHVYEAGIHNPADGRQVPWNTLALWNPKFLWSLGTPLIGDGPVDQPENKGVEEVCTIAVIQAICPSAEAKLTLVPGQNWDTGWFDAERLAKHEKKMASKVSRPAAQLAEMGLKGPKVTHI